MLKINPKFNRNYLPNYSYIVLAQQFKIISSATVNVFFPHECEICSTDLGMNENHICLSCLYDLPYVENKEQNQEALQKLFWGRTDIKNAFTLFNYQKGNQTQELLQLIKYKKKTKLARYLGRKLGEGLTPDKPLDLIVPVPLHPKKKRIRGYNQASLIAQGIRDTTQLKLKENLLKRIQHNPSQTTVTKFDRWENVRSIFKVASPKQLKNKHVLLVDDVLTTGATLEACIKQMLKIEGCTVSVATLAARI